jgi:orotate phosphoribosyltransferase
VIEDLVSTGKSSLQVVDVLRNAGMEVVGMVSIFTYGFDEGVRAFEAKAVPYHSLTNYPTLIQLAIEQGIVTAEQETVLLKWRENPGEWMQTGV